MAFITAENRVVYEEAGQPLGYVTFPAVGEGLVVIDHTVVSPILRGRGIASQLIETAARALRSTGRTAELSCSYAARWFDQHPEFSDVRADGRAEF